MLRLYKVIKITLESELKTWVVMNLTTIHWIVLKTTKVIKASSKRIPLWIWLTNWMVNKIRSLPPYVFSYSIWIRYKVHLWNYYKDNKVSRFLNSGLKKLCLTKALKASLQIIIRNKAYILIWKPLHMTAFSRTLKRVTRNLRLHTRSKIRKSFQKKSYRLRLRTNSLRACNQVL